MILKCVTTLAALGGLVSSAPAMAATYPSQTIAISAQVAKSCGMAAPSGTIVLNATNQDYAASANFTCNYNGSLAITVRSRNGALKHTTDSNAPLVSYSLAVTGNTGGTYSGTGYVDAATVTSTTNITTTGNGGTSVTTNQGSTSPAFLAIHLNALPTVAGTYADDVTVTIAP